MSRRFSPALCGALTVLLTAAAAAQSSPPPAITLITPSTAPAGTPGLGMAVNGANFQAGSVVAWNGSPVTTAYLSSTQVNASIPGTFLANPAVATITVINPGGVLSNGIIFTVTGSPLTISTTAIPQGAVGTAYAFSLTAAGGTAPYTWSAVSVAPGLVLNSAGLIAGTPTTAGTFNFAVQVADSAGQPAAKTFSITITGPQFSITTTSPLPNGNTGQSYSQTLVASGGTTPYRWTVGTGFPPGLTLDPASGVISGVPTTGGAFNFIVQVTDATQLAASRTFALTVNSAPLKITTVPPLFTGTVGVAYAQTFAASGGSLPYRWTILSGSPGGLTLDATTGTLQGTPQTAGTFNFTVQVSDSASAQASQPFSLVVNPPALTITTGSTLPSGTVGVSYRQIFGVVGGTAPYAWSLISGSVPGLTLDASGTLSGTPSAPGTFTPTIQAKDTAGLTTTKAFTISISPASLTITTPTQLPDATLGAPFSQTMTASGGATPYTWSTNGLPDGLTIDAGSGVISGVPAAAGTYSFTVRVIDAARTTYVDLFRINVNLPPTPSATISGMPQTAQPAQQIPLTVSLDAAFPALISGQLVLSFAPDSGGGDSTIRFASGGRTADFTVPAGTTSAVSATPLALQTGTAAGTITVSLRLQAGGIDITPTPAPAVTTRVERAAPVIQSARLIRSGNGLSIEVTGFSTAREVTQAAFSFSAAGQTSTIMVPVENLFNTWYQDPSSGQYGSQFMFTQPFTIQGDANSVTPQSVTLTNRVGSVSANITQ